MKTFIITFACLLLGLFIISTNFVVISHTINFSYKWLIPVFVCLCKLLINKLSEYVQVLITNKLSNLIVLYLPPKLFNFCYRLISKLNEKLKIILDYLSYNYPTLFWALKRYYLIYSYLSNKYPTPILWLKEGYWALFLIVICSCNLDLYIAFTAFTVGFLMIIYIRYIDPSFSRKYPVLYWFLLIVSLLIIAYSIIYLPYIVYVRAPRKAAGGRPTGHKSRQNPDGPPGNNNIDPCMQQSSDNKKKATKKKTTKKNKQQLTEIQREEKNRKDRERYHINRNDPTVDDEGLTWWDKKLIARTESNNRKKNDPTVDDNGLTWREKKNITCRKSARLNPERTSESKHKYRTNNPEKVKESKSKYKKSDKGKQTRKTNRILNSYSGYE